MGVILFGGEGVWFWDEGLWWRWKGMGGGFGNKRWRVGFWKKCGEGWVVFLGKRLYLEGGGG